MKLDENDLKACLEKIGKKYTLASPKLCDLDHVEHKNERYGSLTVLQKDLADTVSEHVLVRCDCSHEFVIEYNTLKCRGGKHPCYHCNKRLQKYAPALRTKFRNYKKSALIRKIEFKLTDEEMAQYFLSPCKICGKESDSVNSNGIDRIDNTEGYYTKNCRTLCGPCNYAKGKGTEEEFHIWLNRLVKHRT